MGIDRKTALARVAGLAEQIEIHLAKIKSQHDVLDGEHWRREIRNWLLQIERLLPKLGKKTAVMFEERIIRWNLEVDGASHDER